MQVYKSNSVLSVELGKVCLGYEDELVETEGIRVAYFELRVFTC